MAESFIPQGAGFGDCAAQHCGTQNGDNGRVGPSNHGADGDVAAFFARNGFDALATQDQCDEFARRAFPTASLKSVAPQGYCSYTIAVNESHLLQFRPSAFALNLGFSEEARRVFGSLVPAIRHMGSVSGTSANALDAPGGLHLHVYLQERIQGETLAAFQQRKDIPPDAMAECRRRLVEDIAQFFAVSLRHARYEDGSEPFAKGHVGSTLRWRGELLQQLRQDQARRYAVSALRDLRRIEASPWCLTHGDMVPANIMVDPRSGRLTGLIDWAEGEWLPFGVGLYGLEEVLGQHEHMRGFVYYPEHEALRDAFWATFSAASGLSVGSHAGLAAASSARRLGILLWRGIAFEDGRIDRVVEQGRDDAEIQKLELFLSTPDRLPRRQPHAGGLSSALSMLRRLCEAMSASWKRLRVPLPRFFGSSAEVVALAKTTSDSTQGRYSA
ncbi:hypothetical protein B0I35DRAFT_403808 [Stachybotrys elegans]|uniref:Aminoglycoside phosphotransferase domain-containing protein n=1 Tax=Stachybotrys elegans TaxID=80388 RepID=A0A8K0T0U7_9HYPO|nr:hypothetical protein B0I35DRAFT_403808 [Stachybotrys elegans]